MATLEIDKMEYATDGAAQAAYVSDTPANLESYSEATIKTQGDYSLKLVADTSAQGKKVSHIFTNPNDLTGVKNLKFDIRSNRTGGNIKANLSSVAKLAASFNGSTSKIDFGNNFNFDSDDAFSFNMWLKYLGGYKMIFGKNEDAINHAHSGWALFSYNSAPYLQLNAGTYYQENEIQQSYQNNFDGSWQMVTVTYDGSLSAAGLKLYINGTENPVGNTGSNNLTGSILNDKPALLGATYDGDSAYNMSGEIDELGVWDRVLTAQEISDLYNSSAGVYGDITHAPFDTNFVAGYHFDEGSGTTATDFTESSIDGTNTDITYVPGVVSGDAVTVTEITPNIVVADQFQTINWDISAIADNTKESVNKLSFEIVDASSVNTAYIDNVEIAQAIDVIGLI